MPQGMIVTGPSGAGKTLLGKEVARFVGCAFLDLDDYIWRWDTQRPFSVLVPREEKISRLMAAVKQAGCFVMAGSMDSFHQHFDRFFQLAVFLSAPPSLRAQRIHQRELARFGSRVLPGGDLYSQHQQALQAVPDYERGTGDTTQERHRRWLASLSCPVLQLDGCRPVEENAVLLARAWWERCAQLSLQADGLEKRTTGKGET